MAEAYHTESHPVTLDVEEDVLIVDGERFVENRTLIVRHGGYEERLTLPTRGQAATVIADILEVLEGRDG